MARVIYFVIYLKFKVNESGGLGHRSRCPGTVVVSRCDRLAVDVGKCSVCGLVKAEWIDREAGVLLCEHCYGRVMKENDRRVGVRIYQRIRAIPDAVISCMGAIDLD